MLLLAGLELRGEIALEAFAVVVVQPPAGRNHASFAVAAVSEGHWDILARVRKRKPATSAARAAAKRLFEAHERREPFAPLAPELAPRTAEDAYAIQDSFVALRAERLGAIGGYKIALSSKEMQRFVGVDEPQAGVMLESTLRQTPARVRAADYVHLIIEFEITFRMAADLPAADAPYTRQSLVPFVQAVMPAIEIA